MTDWHGALSTGSAALLRCAVLLTALVLSGVGAGAAGHKVALTLSQSDNHGRIILDFSGETLLPKHQTRIANGVFVVEFDEPIEVNVDSVPLELKDYVSVARRDPDGTGVRFALARGVKVNTIEAGEKLFIDFLPHDWQGLPPNLPPEVVAELARRAQAAIKEMELVKKLQAARQRDAKVSLRVGENPTFTRFVFRWNLPFTNAFEREGDIVSVTFDQVAELDLTDVKTHLPKGLKDIVAEIKDAALNVRMTLDPSVEVRAFNDGDAYVVDLTPKAGEAANTAQEAVDKAISDAKGGTNHLRTASHPLPATEETAPASVDAPLSTAETTDVGPAATVPAPAPAGELPKPARGNPESVPQSQVQHAKFIRTEARRIGNSIRITIPFSEPTPAAVFMRGQSLWLVFDSTVPLDVGSVRAALGQRAREVALGGAPTMTSLRIDLTDLQLTTIGADGSAWIITIGDMMLEPSRPLQVLRSTATGGKSVLKVELEDFGSVHQIDDPIVGDRIHVVTALGPPRGMIKPQQFAELQTLPSAHGIAAIGFTDDFRIVGERPNTLVLGRFREGLSITKGGGDSADLGLAVPDATGARRSFIDLRDEIRDPGTLRARLTRLRDHVVNAEEGARSAARFQLAAFYLNQRMPFEALGLLRAIADQDAATARRPEFVVMRAAAETLAGRAEEALAALSKSDFETNPDAALWRTIAAAQKQDWLLAQKSAPVARPVIGQYPLGVLMEYGLAAAQSAIELNDFATATAQMAELGADHVDRKLQARFDVLRGRIADAAGHSEEALTFYDSAAKADVGQTSVDAEYRALRLGHRDGLISAEKVINRLDQLSVSWRGDETELKVLRFLAQLRVETGDYRAAFEAMKSAVHAAPKADTARLIHDEMTSVFVALFLDGKADAMDPVDALSLYYDFREMTPVGRRGDEMVRHLAARLVDIDLLDQASELLQHQVDHRLKGAARAQIAADLASIYLLNDKPERALAVLSKTRQAQLPARLEHQRRLIEARAMAETSRIDQAIELVRMMEGRDIDRLRADIFWNARRWQGAGEQYEKLNGSRWSDAFPLDEQERLDILKAAIAYSRADDQMGLDRLRSKYTRKMAESPHAKAFEIVTRAIDAQGVDFVDVARRVAATDSLDAFLKEYRDHYMREALASDDNLADTNAGPAPGAETPAPAEPPSSS